MLDLRARFLVLHLVHQLEALDQVTAAEFPVGHVDRGMAVHARSRLLRHGLALGERLIVEHEGVAALLAEVLGERVAGPENLQPRVFFQPRLRDDAARVLVRRGSRDRFAAAVARAHLIDGAPVAVVLQRKVPAPHRGIDRLVVQLDDAVERVAGLLLPREDADQERGQRYRGHRGERGDDDRIGNSAVHSICPTSLWHFVHASPPRPLSTCAGSIDAVISAWHLRHARSVTS